MNRVYISRCPDYDEKNIRKSLEEVFKGLGGVESFIKPNDRVVLKPNLVSAKPPEKAATTHPALVKALGGIIREAGGIPVIAESPGGLYSELYLRHVYNVCGMTEAARQAGIELNFDTSEVDVDYPDGMFLKKVRAIKPLVEADVVINLPKLKTHGQMVYTGAVKNMFGAIPGVRKAEYHFRMSGYSEFANTLIDIHCCLKPTLNIMDAVVGMEGRGPTSGNPRSIGLILGSRDAFALDLAALYIMGIDPRKVPVFDNAIKRGMCPEKLDKADILGEDIDAFRQNGFDVPQLEVLRDIQFFDNRAFRFVANRLKPKVVFDHERCIGCAECQRNCPANVIEMKNKRPRADMSQCIRCFCCQELCPVGAVTVRRHGLVRLLIKKG